jgi:hypothetical protein
MRAILSFVLLCLFSMTKSAPQEDLLLNKEYIIKIQSNLEIKSIDIKGTPLETEQEHPYDHDEGAEHKVPHGNAAAQHGIGHEAAHDSGHPTTHPTAHLTAASIPQGSNNNVTGGIATTIAPGNKTTTEDDDDDEK